MINTIMLLTLWVNLFISSSFVTFISSLFIHFFSLPLDLLLMAFTRPISSQTSLIILKRLTHKVSNIKEGKRTSKYCIPSLTPAINS